MADNSVDVQITLTGSEKFKSDVNSAMGSLKKASLSTSPVVNMMKNDFSKAFNFIKTSAIAAGVGVAGAFVAISANALKTAADFETMEVGLTTAMGGSEKTASKMFAKLNKFAGKTPLQVKEVVKSFVKLKNMGLDPSLKALTAYGDTASAMGKSLNDMVEAVADAATGEFERLKEFGIRASQQGDKVTFTFQGVKTTVGKNAKEIEKYLIGIGETKFAGGMEKQSKTLTGLLSTLKDTWSQFAVEFIKKTGVLDMAKNAVKFLTDNLYLLNPAIKTVKEWLEKLKNPTKEQKEEFEKIKDKVLEVVDSIVGKNGLVASVGTMLTKFLSAEDGSGGVVGALDGVKVAIDGLTVYLDLQIAKWQIYLDLLITVMALLGNVDANKIKQIGMTPEDEKRRKEQVKLLDDLYTNKGGKKVPTPKPKEKKKKTEAPLVIPKGSVIPKPGDLFNNFASGGIVGGNYRYGDKVMARMNSGEMILNKGQQSVLFNLLKNVNKGNSINFNGGVNFSSNSSPMQQQNNFVNMLMQLS